MAEVTEINPSQSTPFDESLAENTHGQSTQTTPKAKNKGGRPQKGKERPPEVRQPQFFDRVASVPREDWGTRAFMYVYADEPVCKAKTFGTTRYILKSSVPILDLEGLKQDYGSFKGWMSLNLRKTGKDATDEVDRLDFEIYDPKNPPKIPRAAWANDDRNARWIALLPPEAPPANAAASSLMEGARFYKEMREDLKEEMAPPDQPPTRTSEIVETMRAAKELFSTPTAPATAPVSDPFEIAAKMNAARANDPMIPVLMQLLKDSQAANEAARTREYELLKERATAPPAKSFLDQAMELASNPDKLEPIKKLAQAFGFGNGGETVRASRTTGMDILNNLVSGPAGAALAQGLGQLLMAAPSMLAGNPANGQPMQTPPPVLQPQVQQGGPPQPETPEQRINRVGAQVTRQMIGEFFMKGATGEDFAVSMYNFWPEDTVFLQSFGAENLVDRYRKFPQAWAVLSYREQEFITFMQQFCAWKAPAEDDGTAIPVAAEADGVEDLEDKETGE